MMVVSRKYFRNCVLNALILEQRVTCGGSEFQIKGPENEKLDLKMSTLGNGKIYFSDPYLSLEGVTKSFK
jgi:hypothetical protein